jgi:hypothetical protein
MKVPYQLTSTRPQHTMVAAERSGESAGQGKPIQAKAVFAKKPGQL